MHFTEQKILHFVGGIMTLNVHYDNDNQIKDPLKEIERILSEMKNCINNLHLNLNNSIEELDFHSQEWIDSSIIKRAFISVCKSVTRLQHTLFNSASSIDETKQKFLVQNALSAIFLTVSKFNIVLKLITINFGVLYHKITLPENKLGENNTEGSKAFAINDPLKNIKIAVDDIKIIVNFFCSLNINMSPSEIENNFCALVSKSINSILFSEELTNSLRALAVEQVYGSFKQKESGYNIINASPVTVKLMKREKGDIKLGKNSETGEEAIFTILDGYITPYEKDILECISKFKSDGQITKNSKIWFSLGQLYRAMRHGTGTQSPTKEQRAALMATLTELSEPRRKLTFKINDYLKIWGDFETNGGRIRIIGFDELFGKIQGKEDILIVLDNTPLICAIAENLHMWEAITQDIKSIKQKRYYIKYLNHGKVERRSFKSDQERQRYCKAIRIEKNNIFEQTEEVKPWALSVNRIILRSVLLTFVYGYIRARGVDSKYSNKMPYTLLFARCGLNNSHHETIKRSCDDITVIMNHLTDTIDELQAWGLYRNKSTSKSKFDGIIIFLQIPDKNKNIVIQHCKALMLLGDDR